MLTERDLKQITEEVLVYCKSDQTSIVLSTIDSALTRFANNAIHQNVAETDVGLLVEVVVGRKKGIASINNLTSAGIRKVVDRAMEIAGHQVENPEFRGLTRAAAAKRVDACVDYTAGLDPAGRAAGVAIICKKSIEQGLVAAGAFSNTTSQLVVANSEGVFQYHCDAIAEFNTVIMTGSSSGFASAIALDARAIDPEALATEAIGKAVRGRNPSDLEPGDYAVVLEEYAACDVVDFLAYLGFGALAVEEKRSFMAEKFGQKVVGANITIWDDGLSPETIPMPFDYEGVPRKRVNLILGGIANAVCYDTETAQRVGKESTGHALPPGDTFGPIPCNLFLKPGAATKEEMIRSTKRGIMVTRFHYTRQVHPLSVTVTGMTRDGTFLIENGEITRPIKNLRFTQSYLDALNNVEMIGRETKLHREFFPYNRIPALKIGSWSFVSATQY
ncbi:MAG: metallopeptidase TldD-related protein [Dehalococcoidia bacterium]|nr:metallopeptidase TldD-related protein [Dehalococcoidia bacterium]